jgi:uncharacterized protein
MRRKDRQVTDPLEITAIMERCDVCRVAMFDSQYPYIVTMNFGMRRADTGIELYFHCAREGRKLDLIRGNPNVAFEMDCSHHLITADSACGYTMEFESVCGTGLMEILPPNRHFDAMAVFMSHYAGSPLPLAEKDLQNVCILRLTVRELTAKRLMKRGAV